MKLYVGNLGDDGEVQSEDLRPLFETFGEVTECECIKNFAFVHMSDEGAAAQALSQLNGTTIKGRKIRVEKSESKGPRRPSQKLFVGNIKEGTTNEDLRAVFEPHVEVLEADVIKNFGFVHIDADVPRKKINDLLRDLNGYNLNGSNIRVQISTSTSRQKPGNMMVMDQATDYRGYYEYDFMGRGGPAAPINAFGGGSGFGARGASSFGGPMRAGPYSMGAGRQSGAGAPYRGGEPYPPPSYVRDRYQQQAAAAAAAAATYSAYDDYATTRSNGYGRAAAAPAPPALRTDYYTGAGEFYDRRAGFDAQQAIRAPAPEYGYAAAAPRDPYLRDATAYGRTDYEYDPRGLPPAGTAQAMLAQTAATMTGYPGVAAMSSYGGGSSIYSRRSPQTVRAAPGAGYGSQPYTSSTNSAGGVYATAAAGYAGLPLAPASGTTPSGGTYG